MKRYEFFKEGKQLKRLLKVLSESNFAEWLEVVESMFASGVEEFNHEETFVHCYNDDGYYQICVVQCKG